MFKELKADIARHRADEPSWLGTILSATVWAVAWYRFGHWIYRENCPRLLRLLLKPVYIPVYLAIQNILHIRIPPSAEIGPGLYLSHVGGLLISPEAVIGKNCDLGQWVTIGVSAMGRRGVPQLGDNVYVGAGATLIGKIKIGDGAKIAANTLVMTNVPAGATVIGVPGRVVVVAPMAEAARS
jgi:serine O-acetyltransferase